LNTIANMNAMRTGTWDYDYFGIGDTPSVASTKWNLGATTPFFFKVKPTQTSFAAIADLAATKTRGECAGALTACILKAAADVLGQVAFDALHAAGTLELGYPGGSGGSWIKHRDFVAGAEITDETKHIPGDFVYMMNKSDYGTKMAALKKDGFWTGENAIYVGGGLYSGLGLYNKTSAQLRQKLADGYKADTGDDVPAPLTDDIKFTTRARLKVQ
jgi:hypothetical protein